MNWSEQVVLVTGGTGSFGKKFIEIMLRQYHAKKLVIFSRDELKQHDMRASGFDHPSLRYFIGDVRDQSRFEARSGAASSEYIFSGVEPPDSARVNRPRSLMASFAALMSRSVTLLTRGAGQRRKATSRCGWAIFAPTKLLGQSA